MNTDPKYLVFLAEDYRHVLAFQYDADDTPEPICAIRIGMTLRDLIREVEDWETR